VLYSMWVLGGFRVCEGFNCMARALAALLVSGGDMHLLALLRTRHLDWTNDDGRVVVGT